jgi:hypothetical protein
MSCAPTWVYGTTDSRWHDGRRSAAAPPSIGSMIRPHRRGRAMGRVYRHDLFLIREVAEALMLSLPIYHLQVLVQARPLVSVAVSCDRHSVSYSPLGAARSEPPLTF